MPYDYDIVDGSRNYSFTFDGPSVDVRKLLYPTINISNDIARAMEDAKIKLGKLDYGTLRMKLQYKRVVFNPPATIVLWEDGTKTVVKCGENDVYDPEKGLALCFMKKALGNTSRALNDILHAEIRHENKEEA